MIKDFVESFHRISKIYDKRLKDKTLQAEHLKLIAEWLDKYYPLKERMWKEDLTLYKTYQIDCYNTRIDQKMQFFFGEEKLVDCAVSIMEKLDIENSLPVVTKEEGFKEIMVDRGFNNKLKDTAIEILDIYYDLLKEDGLVLKKSKKSEYTKRVEEVANEYLHNVREIADCSRGLDALKANLIGTHFVKGIPFRPETFIMFKIVSEANGFRFRELDSAIKNLKEINRSGVEIDKNMKFGF